MPRRRIDLDDEQYEELEDLFFTLDNALLDYADFEVASLEDYQNLVADARDVLQGLLDEAEYVREPED